MKYYICMKMKSIILKIKNLELREKFNIKFQYLNSDEIKDLEQI